MTLAEMDENRPPGRLGGCFTFAGSVLLWRKDLGLNPMTDSSAPLTLFGRLCVGAIAAVVGGVTALFGFLLKDTENIRTKIAALEKRLERLEAEQH
jgi:hypothetical protein